MLQLFVVTPVSAVEVLQLDIGDVASADWSARATRIELNLGSSGAIAARISANEVTLGANAESWTDVVLSCPELEIAAAFARCPQLSITGTSANLGPQRLAGSAVFDGRDQAAGITIEGGSVAGSALQLDAKLAGGRWQSQLDLPNIDLASLLALAARFLPDGEAGQADGSMGLKLSA